jgi:hypothetical protein
MNLISICQSRPKFPETHNDSPRVTLISKIQLRSVVHVLRREEGQEGRNKVTKVGDPESLKPK